MTEWTESMARGSVQLRRQTGKGVTGSRDTVDRGSLLLTPGPQPRDSPSASLLWAATHRRCQEQGPLRAPSGCAPAGRYTPTPSV